MEVVTLGHPVLRQVAPPVTDCRSAQIQQLIDQLIALTAACQGVGIAAPQVGVSLQLMIVASHPTPRYPNAPTMPPLALINPRVLSQSKVIVTDWEGCLSVPGQRGQVPRAESVMVAYTDRQGAPQTVEFVGFVARIFQHEYDHLQGKVFLDRVETPDAVVSEAAYQAIVTAQGAIVHS
jgi:peptide deformylase